MHDYRRFIEQEMRDRNMRPADVTKAGGPSPQVLSKILRDKRPTLVQRPDQETIEGLATAFRVDVEKVLASVATAMGLPTTVTVAGLETASNEELLDEIRRRMERTHDKHATTHDHHTLPDRDQAGGHERRASDDGEGVGVGEKTGGRPVGVGLDQLDFDLAAHPDMPLERDRFDAEHGDAGEKNQDKDT